MPSGDGLLMRVKPFGGRLDADDLRVIADVAERFGNAVVELTGRGNLQLRGLSQTSAASACAVLVAARLADPDPARERRRNVIAVPPCDDALVAGIEATLSEIEGLPPKFCVAVGDVAADIVVRDGFVGAGGQWEPCAPAALPAAVRRIATRLAAENSPPFPWGRGLGGGGTRHQPPGPLPPTPSPERRGSSMLLGLPFGQTDAASLRALSDHIGQAELHTTPWRALHLAPAQDPASFATLGFITDRDDPRTSISACIGAPGCTGATTPTRAHAAFLASLGLRHLHISGCAKGCAHPGPATTLTGGHGRYDLVRHGRASDPPEATGLTILQAAELLR